ncbi:triacylglycerol lipase [Rhodococcus sp. PvR044]|uniref:esterase/lipase family protein n=1 Tax=Rhodococcus sp. PvR044 TaxID=3156402 RepID=UPI003391A944
MTRPTSAWTLIRRAGTALITLGALTFAIAGPAGAGSVGDSEPAEAPPGANLWECRPTADHPRPVVLLHGTMSNQNSWDGLSPELAADGYCVFTLNYGKDPTSMMGAMGMYATGDIPTSARQVGAFVGRVLQSTGADQVDVVAHSQGGVVARQFLKFEGGANAEDPSRNKVRNLITLGATNHGTTMSGMSELAKRIPPMVGVAEGVAGKASVQQLVDSPVITALNSGGDTMPGIDYTVVASRNDSISTPPEATFLAAGPGATVENLWIQDLCAADHSDHIALATSPTAGYIVRKALDPSFSADRCSGK